MGPAIQVLAADDAQVPVNVQPGQVQGHNAAPVPQGPEAILPLPEANPNLLGYRPIPESMLPTSIAPAMSSAPATPANVPTPTNLGGPAYAMGPYTLGKDDVVQIVVQGQPDFTGTFLIGPDGGIQYGFLGDVPAEGLTKDELAQVIAQQLKRFVRVPSVNVIIVGFNSKAVYILGRVARPGKYAMRGDSVKIRDALIAAGLVVRHAKLRKVHIVKSDPSDPSYRVVDMFKVLYKGKMRENVDLVNGDIIVVPTTVWGGINDFLTELIAPGSHAARAAAVAAL
jgi:polysaccharide export outer membrane protein